MRDNTAALQALPSFALFKTPKGEQWAKITVQSPRDGHNLALKYARTANETWGGDTDGSWHGLGEQTRKEFDATGIANLPLTLVQSTLAKMPEKQTRLGDIKPAISGSYWDTPSVLANIPMAARRKYKTRIAPIDIKIAFFVSAGISAEAMSTITAKIAKAIWNYTLAGGVVNFTMYHCGRVTSSTGAKGFAIETRVNAADIAGLSLVLSPAYYRTIAGPLQTAFSEANRDGIHPRGKIRYPVRFG